MSAEAPSTITLVSNDGVPVKVGKAPRMAVPEAH